MVKLSRNVYECYSDIFNELIDRIIVHKQGDKQIKLDIYIKSGESIYITSDNLDKKFHLLDSYTSCCLTNDTLTREITSILLHFFSILHLKI